MNYSDFFMPGQPIMALPNWQQPRLYIVNESLRSRWEFSKLYPAFRPSAKIYRFVLRVRIFLQMGSIRISLIENYHLSGFLENILPEARASAVLVGTPGPAQKIIVQLINSSGQIEGYIKYAEKPVARQLLQREAKVLTSLPHTLGYRLLKYAQYGNGVALLMQPVKGRQVRAKLPPPKQLPLFLQTLVNSEAEFTVREHPWVQQLLIKNGSNMLTTWLDCLNTRLWPIAIQHGDLAPWNLLLGGDGQIRAIDWEYGCTEGFPYIDSTYYILQVAFLIYRWPAKKTAEYACQWLKKESSVQIGPKLQLTEAQALVSLSAFYAHQQAARNGTKPTAPIQRWRQQVWESKL